MRSWSPTMAERMALAAATGRAATLNLDWMMPGMSGVDVCRKVREWHDAPYVYIILLTGMDQLDDLVKGMEAGADDFIRKPFAEKELEVRLRAGQRILDLQSELLAAEKVLEIQATRDALTGLWNRRAILEETSPGAGALQARKVSTRSDFGRYRLFQRASTIPTATLKEIKYCRR